jgi:hypothetical protein
MLLPAQGQTMELGVSEFGTYANAYQGDDYVIPRAFVAAGYVGARWSRQIVERGAFYDGAGNPTSFDFATLDRWVSDVSAHEMRPFLTLTNARQISGGEDQISERQRTADASTYAAWCGQVADRYDGGDPAHPQVNDFSVWNEPNLSKVGDLAPARYFNYYAACRFAIKQRIPGANVYFGELSSSGEERDDDACQWLADATGGVRTVTEGVAVHPYQYTVDPTTTASATPCRGIGRLGEWPARIAQARLVTASGGAPQLLVSEFGYCSERTSAPAGDPYVPGMTVASCAGAGNVLSPAVHAAYLGRAWTVARNAGATLFNYHTLAKRNQWQWRRTDDSGAYVGGGMWESGILDNPMPFASPLNTDYSGDSYGASIEALRTATGTVNPAATGATAVDVGFRAATLNGTVVPNDARTTYRFEYGPTTAYGSMTPAQTVSAGGGPTAVSATLTGLSPNTTYHYRLVVSNRAGRGQSSDQTFKTRTHRPAALLLPDGSTEVFLTGFDGAIWRLWYESGWRSERLGGEAAGDPAALLLSDGTKSVFFRNTAGSISQLVYDGSRWQLWGLGGDASGDPAAALLSGGGIGVYFRNSSGSLSQLHYDGRWHLNGISTQPVVGRPSALTAADGSHAVYFRDSAGQIVQMIHDGTWHEFGLGGSPAGDPVAVDLGGSHSVFFRDTGGRVSQLIYDRGWHLFGLGGDAAGDPGAANIPSGNTTEVFFRDSSGGMSQLLFDGARWHTFGVGGAPAGDPSVVFTEATGTTGVYFMNGASGVDQLYYDAGWYLFNICASRCGE